MSVTVSGGLDTVEAPGRAMLDAAAALRRTAGELRDAGETCAGVYWSLWTAGSLGAGATVLLQPAQDTLRVAQTGLATAATALAIAAGWLAAAAQLYEATDGDLLHHVESAVHSGSTVVAEAGSGLVRLPAALAEATVGLAEWDPARASGTAATADPQLLDTVLDVSAAAQLASPLFRSATRGVETFLLAHFTDGHPVVTAAGPDTSVVATQPPRGLVDLVNGLAWRNRNEDEAAATTTGGEIDVKFLHHPDGSRSVIVDIPGTKDWGLAGHDPDVTGWASNLRAIQGVTTTYENGVFAAMRAAGVRPDDHVLLVGHSLGGMVAVTAARDAVRSGRFDVTDVITAGSPIARTVGTVPSSVRVLALENEHDAVPQLDGRANPARGNVVTVTADVRATNPGAAHSLDSSYITVAAEAEHGDDPAVRYDLAGATEYLDADRVQAQRYVITRTQ